jgi:hypothetical protein
MSNFIILLSAFLALGFTNASGQDSWQVLLNKKPLLKGIIEQDDKTATINSATFKSDDCITIKYQSAAAEAGWGRTFFINNANDHVVKQIEIKTQNGTATIKAADLKELAQNKQPFFIYTTSLPSDPSKAASIRVRRIKLCKIEWN